MIFPDCHDIVYENGKLYEFIPSIRKWAEVKIPRLLAYLEQGDEVKMSSNLTPYPLNVLS